MNAGGETADQVVRMSLQGIEVAANVALKAGGMASKSLAVTLYAILTDRKKVKGKTRLNSMLKSGKELKVFAIHHNDLKTFTQEARRYGVLYCVLKEKCNTDGICDIMVRAEDAAKISRIVDKFELATIDTKAINDYAAAKQNSIQFKEADVLNDDDHDRLVKTLLDSMNDKKRDLQNPKKARTEMGVNRFEHTLKKEEDIIEKRRSVRKELDEIRQNKSKRKTTVKQQVLQKNSKKKKNKKKAR